MKAIVLTTYGSPEVLQLKEMEKPFPRENEVLIRIYATTVVATDPLFRKGEPFITRFFTGLIRPTRPIPGDVLAGEIEAVGKDVNSFGKADRVFAACSSSQGGHAEYICLPQDGPLARKPANMSYEEAAAVPFGGLEALHSLGKIDIQRGEKVLIVGAGGSIGTWTVQLAKHYGAEVTGVDHTEKLDMLRSIGADHVIDYTREDFTKNGRTYDVIFDTIGKSPFSGSLRSLNENGTYLNANPGVFGGIRWRWASNRSSKKVIPWTAGYTTDNLLALKELIEAGKIKPVIDRRYPLEQTAEAHRYVDEGHKKGNVVITVGHHNKT